VTPIPLDRVPELAEALTRMNMGPLLENSLTGYAGRNDNWAGSTEDGQEVFVKRLSGKPADVAARYQRLVDFENAVCGRTFRSWRSPRFLGGDEETGVLAFVRVPSPRSATSLLEDGDLGVDLAERLGRSIGELHSLPMAARQVGGPGPAALGGRLLALSLEEYEQASGAEIEAWALLHHDKRVHEALNRLMEQSAHAAPVPSHCDLRVDQFLLSGEELYLTDWEEFRPADPALDLGSFVGEWLQRAASRMFRDLDSVPTSNPGEQHEQIVDKGAQELDAVRPAIEAIWAGYRAGRPDAAADADLAVRVTAWAGWHLFDRMLATAMFSGRLGAVDRGMAGIGRNALVYPEKFVSALGLDR
jgi:phosphotransferase family enzyme